MSMSEFRPKTLTLQIPIETWCLFVEFIGQNMLVSCQGVFVKRCCMHQGGRRTTWFPSDHARHLVCRLESTLPLGSAMSDALQAANASTGFIPQSIALCPCCKETILDGEVLHPQIRLLSCTRLTIDIFDCLPGKLLFAGYRTEPSSPSRSNTAIEVEMSIVHHRIER
jgi:hypothetical protein